MSRFEIVDSLDEIVGEIIFDEEQIAEEVEVLGDEISADYGNSEILIIGVLRGAFVFMADLLREIDSPLAVDFMLVSSYEDSKESSGVVRIIKDAKVNIQDRHVLIVEDIVDTGLTYHNLKQTLETRDPKSLSVCTLLNKKVNRRVDVSVDYYGFEAPDAFLVGYGLDYREHYRECPYIFKPTNEALSKLD